MKYLGWVILVICGVLGLVNSVAMLVSPAGWFRLPRWMGEKGSMAERECTTGAGALAVRIAGAILLGLVGWTVYEIVSRP